MKFTWSCVAVRCAPVAKNILHTIPPLCRMSPMKLPIDLPVSTRHQTVRPPFPHGATPAAPTCPTATVAPRRATVAWRGSAIIS